jgi:signal transduction histidine kinase
METLRVLNVEDSAADATLLERHLTRAGAKVISERVDTPIAMSMALKQQPWDVILCDYNMPHFSAHGALRLLKETGLDIPLIVISGTVGEEVAVQTMLAGACDYLLKDNLTRLVPTIERALEEAKNRRAREQAEEELRKAKDAAEAATRAKDRFLSHVSHELRSPLTVIHQFLTLMLDGLLGEINEEQRESLETALSNTLQLREMISDLLDVTRAETGILLFEAHPVSLLQVFVELERTYHQTAKQRGIMFLVQQPRNFPRVHADPQRLRQILANLIDNAFKFTEQGKISIRAVLDDRPGFVRISVSDTGCGISPQGIPLVFNRLYQEAHASQTNRQGLGLGLHICEQLVSLHGGRIWVESKGQGSTFFFTIRINEENCPEMEH